MSITIHWWMLPIILFIAPFIYMQFRKEPSSIIDLCLDVIGFTFICWGLAIGILIGHFF